MKRIGMKSFLLAMISMCSTSTFASNENCTVLYSGDDIDIIQTLESKGLTINKSTNARMAVVIEAPTEGPYTRHSPDSIFWNVQTHAVHGMEIRIEGTNVVAYRSMPFTKDIGGNIDPNWQKILYKKTKKDFIKVLKEQKDCLY